MQVFLRPVELSTPVPANFDCELAISRADLRVHHYDATADFNADEWLELRFLVESTEGENLWLMSRTREVNVGKIVFSAYESATKYC